LVTPYFNFSIPQDLREDPPQEVSQVLKKNFFDLGHFLGEVSFYNY